MIDRIERKLAHLLGWHSVGCLGHLECAAPLGKVARIGAGPFGWHHWVDRNTTPPPRLCSARNPRNRGMTCSLLPEHVDLGTDHRMGDGGRWPVVDCPCGCPAVMHIGEIGCPCGLPDEPPCSPVDGGRRG